MSHGIISIFWKATNVLNLFFSIFFSVSLTSNNPLLQQVHLFPLVIFSCLKMTLSPLSMMLRLNFFEFSYFESIAWTGCGSLWFRIGLLLSISYLIIIIIIIFVGFLDCLDLKGKIFLRIVLCLWIWFWSKSL